jgi:hypothetical protein
VIHVVAETGEANSPLLELGDAPAGPRPTLTVDITPPSPLVVTPGPSVNGHKSFFETLDGTPSRPDYTTPYYLVWQFANGRWATLYVQSDPKYILSLSDVARVARGVTEKPFPYPQNFQIDGPLAAADVVTETMGTSGTKLTLRAGSAEIEITMTGGRKSAPNCKTGPDDLRSACVSVSGRLSPPLAAAGLQGILGDIKLLELPTTDVIL